MLILRLVFQLVILLFLRAVMIISSSAGPMGVTVCVAATSGSPLSAIHGNTANSRLAKEILGVIIMPAHIQQRLSDLHC